MPLSLTQAMSIGHSCFCVLYACHCGLQGNYNTFETVRGEQLKNQRRAYEADKAKREHMQVYTLYILKHYLLMLSRTNSKFRFTVRSLSSAPPTMH
jgi:hypothetical protein